MDEFDNSEDEFERLYAQELEFMNELETEKQEKQTSSNETQVVSGTLNIASKNEDVLKEINSVESDECNLLIDEPIQTSLSLNTDFPNADNCKSVKRKLLNDTSGSQNERDVVQESNSVESDECNLLIDEPIQTSLNLNADNPKSVKRKLLNDTSGSQEERGLKRRKSSLPMVGYEIRNAVKVDHDIEVIDRILSHRNLAKNTVLSVPCCAGERSAPTTNTRNCKFHYRIPNGDFQSITTVSGVRLYLDVEDESIFNSSLDNIVDVNNRGQLLSVPYSTLRMEAEKELLTLNTEIMRTEDENSVRRNRPAENDGDNELWVQKYRPRSYLDLLSDEATNRTVLHWMKLWDKLVFGRDAKSKQREKTKVKPKFISKSAPEVIEELDEMNRPQQRVVLLCGPPGLGKTTLAHIIAQHAGYNVVEMNASDDRNVESFRTNLENATTMKSVFGGDKRPNCLIIDEIDGAPAPSINYLVNLLLAKKPKNEPLKGKKKDKFSLLRPVICICNDLYTPSLRPLKQISLVIQFPPTQSTRLAQRLHQISRKQSMKADLSVLLALCNKTENDIRSCLSVLQFVRISSGELKLMDLEGVTVGQKDYQRSLFTVWHDIFALPRPKREPRANPHRQLSESRGNILDEIAPKKERISNHCDPTSLSARFDHILKLAYSCGEYEKLTLGWFENYPNMKFKHQHLEPVTAGLEWATLTDILQKEILHTQSWNLGAYIPLSFVAYHFLFASNQWPKLQFPNQYHEVSSKMTKAKSLVDIMTGGMPAYNRVFSPTLSLVQDILPYLVYILQPPFRPVNVQLFSSQEKDQLNQLVSKMINFNLTYQQEKSLEGAYSFVLDPNIEEIVHFPDIPKPKAIPYSTKQLIAREVELEKVRRAETYFSSKGKLQKTVDKPSKNAVVENSKDKSESRNEKKQSVALPNHLQKLQAKALTKTQATSVVARDFFGRKIVASKEDPKNSKNNVLSSDIWFKFKEGYSNAVRRPVKVRDFFGPNT